MRIKQIVSQHRRDFTAVYECEHCGKQETASGYDDRHFHKNIVPAMVCCNCGQTAKVDYVPRATRYPEGVQI